MAETGKQADKQEVLVSPDGAREWTPEDAAQATNLRARGWAPKGAKASAPKSTK